MENKKKEIRNISGQIIRSDAESRTVEGYALLFNTPSDGLPFVETIKTGALDGVVENSDVFALLNHDQSRGILARSKYGQGTLTLTVDEKGLRYLFEAPHTALGDEVVENLRRGEIDESSFAFDVEEAEWSKDQDGTLRRTINKIKNLYDVSPVYNAAYSATSVYMRCKEMADEELKRMEEEQRKAEEEKRAEEEAKASENAEQGPAASYYEEYEKQFNL